MVFPKNTQIPLLNGSVFDSFIVIWIRDGADLWTMAKSLKDRWIVGPYCDTPGDVNSLHVKNPKMPHRIGGKRVVRRLKLSLILRVLHRIKFLP